MKNPNGTGAEPSPPTALIFSHHPAPYRDPVLTALHARGRVNALVAQYDAECLTHPEWEWPQPEYPQVHVGEGRGRFGKAVGALRLLRERRPDVVVIPGIGSPASAAVMAGAVTLGVPYVYSADTVEYQRTSPWSLAVRERVLRLVLRGAGAAWVPGKMTRRFLESRGLPGDRIFEGCYCLDALAMIQQFDEGRARRGELRAVLGIAEDEFAFVFVGGMIPVRRVPRLVQAYATVRAKIGKVALVLVGGGTELDLVKSEAAALEGVRIVGPVPVRRVPEFFAAGDAYVHPGSEAYSLVAAEAALAGLPIVAGDKVGATPDYVLHEESGLVVGHEDFDGLVQAMSALAADPERSAAWGRRGREHALARNAVWGAEQLEAALLTALSRAGRR
jgi:glycosyltransferase involved in cell wall biosynthesis